MAATPLRPVLLACLGIAAAAQPRPSEAVRQAELAFAKQGAEQGIRKAFLAWLLPEAQVFIPQARTAQAVYGPEPGNPGLLIWHPEANGQAASGELAWSTGPWSYAPKAGEAPLVHGHFLSMWRRQPEGAWRVVADIGVPHAAPASPVPVMAEVRSASAGWEGPGSPEGALNALRQAEGKLVADWWRSGGSALRPYLSADARVLRPRALPFRPGESLEKQLASEAPGDAGTARTVQVAASGDLGWTCGETAPGPDAASFLRVWTFEAGAWRVLFDVRLPHPPAETK